MSLIRKMAANSVQKVRLRKLLLELKKIQGFFLEKWGVDDIYSNSKIFEILIANELNQCIFYVVITSLF